MSRLEAQCVEHITIYHKRITKSRGIRNDEDIYHWATDSGNDVIFLYSRPVPKAAARPELHQRPRLQPNDRKRSSRQPPKKHRAKRKPPQ
ncbi:hypothetical protein CABS03_15427 [Colletotrichum abscissum]